MHYGGEEHNSKTAHLAKGTVKLLSSSGYSLSVWLAWSCVPVLVTDRRAMQSRPTQGRPGEEEEKRGKGTALLGLGRVELSSVKAIDESDKADSWLPTEPQQRFKTKATRSRYSTAVN